MNNNFITWEQIKQNAIRGITDTAISLNKENLELKLNKIDLEQKAEKYRDLLFITNSILTGTLLMLILF